MQKLLIATKNKGKYGEILNILNGLPIEFTFLGDLNVDDSNFLEDGKTYKENSYKKAKYYFDKFGGFVMGEDSGIVVDALSGELGVKTRRWGAGEHVSDQEWIDFFMNRMDGVNGRSARFICSACVVCPDGSTYYFKGEIGGVITEKLMAPIIPGLPLSSCFIAEGTEKVYAALGDEEKNRISHRGQAISQVKRFLKNLANART